jgi:hypothetical protein
MNGTTKFSPHLTQVVAGRVSSEHHVELVDRGQHQADDERDASRAP